MTRCASELALEAYLFDPTRSTLRDHLECCAPCRLRLSRMEREGEEFRRFVEPRTLERVLAGGKPRERRWKRLLVTLVPAGGLAAAAAAMFLFSPGPPDGYVGAKGSPLSLRVWAGAGDGAREIADGERIPADARLRFRVASGQACRLWLLSVDGRGEVSRLFPAAGDAPATVTGGTTLPGGAALDGQAGPERLYAICSPEPIPFDRVERALRSTLAADDGALRRGASLPGLPAGAAQATMLVEKVP